MTCLSDIASTRALIERHYILTGSPLIFRTILFPKLYAASRVVDKSRKHADEQDGPDAHMNAIGRNHPDTPSPSVEA